MPQRQAAGDLSVQAAPAVDDGVVDRLEGGEAVADLATWAQASAGEWSTQATTHTQPAARVQAMVASVPQRWLGA